MTSTTHGSSGDEWRRGWPLVMAAMAGMSLASLPTASFGVMMGPIERELGWSRAEISVGPMLISLLVIVAGTAMGFAVDRIGPRIIALFASALTCGAIALMALTATPWMWWGLWAMIGLASAAMPAVCVSPVTRSFDAGRGLALAVVLSGSGISSFLVPNIANYLVEHYGWRSAYQGLGALWAIIVIPLIFLFLREARRTATPQAQSSRAQPATQLPGYTASEGFRTLAFWKLLTANLLTTAASVALVLNLVPVLISTGITTATAAATAGLVGIATIAGRVFSGWLMDRMSVARIVCCAVIGLCLLPAMLIALPGSVPVAMAGVVLFGLFGGTTTPGLAYLAGKNLGQRSFGTFYASINAGSAIGVGIGPLLANLVYDRTQSYQPVFWAVMPVLVVAALIYGSLGRYPEFADARQES